MRPAQSIYMFRMIISLAAGVLLALAYPSANISFLAWFAPSFLLILIFKSSARQSFLYGILFGIGFFGLLIYWISTFGMVAYIALVLFQSLFIAIFTMLSNTIMHSFNRSISLIIIPALWVAIEWIRSLGIFGFTWGDLGYSQYKVLPIIQIASITGVWGISYLIMFFNTSIANVFIDKNTVSKFWLAVIYILIIFLNGKVIIATPISEAKATLNVSIIQGNIDQDTDEDELFVNNTWSVYSKLTKTAAVDGADITIWPETVVPGNMADIDTRQQLSKLSYVSNISILAGAWDRDSNNNIYNSAFLISPTDGITDKYAKNKLVPFGEYLPARKYLSFLEKYNVTPYDTSAGKNNDPIKFNDVNIGMAICFESSFPYVLQRAAKKGAQIFCVITNDCWYDKTSAAEQHMSFCVLRAVENNRFVMRAASTGISCIIDSKGRIIEKIDILNEDSINRTIPVINRKTFYSKYGDWFVYFCIAVTLVSLIIAIISHNGKKQTLGV